MFINRELSWLKFNKRVLLEAADESVPLFERLKFVSIFMNNLDEFFMVRVGSLFDQTIYNKEWRENKTNMTAQEQITAIFEENKRLARQKDEIYFDLIKRLSKEGIKKVDFSNLSEAEENILKDYYLNEIKPLLSPQVIDSHHPFPFLHNKNLYIGFSFDGGKNSTGFGFIPLSAQFDRYFVFEVDGITYISLVEELILHFAPLLFSKYEFKERFFFRVTRNADIDHSEKFFEQEADWRVVMKNVVMNRKKAAAVRLQVSKELPKELLEYLSKSLELKKNAICVEKSPLDMSFVFKFTDRFKDKEHLFYDKLYETNYPRLLGKEGMMDWLEREKDLLLCYPFHSMMPVIKILEEAADDKNVVSIKITLYRVASVSKVVAALIAAAQKGKEVTVVLELRARFDEENNINWSQQLEDAGCTVIYGMSSYKVHSKLLLITMKNRSEISYISHVGTGNFNESTAKQYTDCSYITTNKRIGGAISNVFFDLQMGNASEEVDDILLLAPKCYEGRLLKLIDDEIEYAKSGKSGKIAVKINALTDKDIIEKLSEASNAGVKVRLFIRGICCMSAGRDGISENIEVISIVGRYLEHSRIYVFGEGERTKMYIGSGDFMTRSTERRVEAAVRIDNPEIQKQIWDMLDILYRDNVKAWEMLPDGEYVKRGLKEGEEAFDSQRFFFSYFEEEAAKTKDAEVKRAQVKSENVYVPIKLERSFLSKFLDKWERK